MNKIIAIGAATFLLSACSVGPDYHPPSLNFSSKWFAPKTKAVSVQPIKTEWWTIFQDPFLTKYIEASIMENKDVKIALSNVRRARALRGVEAGSLLPSISGDASGEKSKSSGASSNFNSGQIRSNYNAGFDASWELDIFGGNRRGIEAANARIGSAVADYNAVMLSTLSEVARNYYEARGLQKRITLTNKNADLFEQTLKLVEDRLKAGEATEFDVARARGQYQSTRARVPNLTAEYHAAVFRLSVLLGHPPEYLMQDMTTINPLPAPPDVVPVGLRSDILRRRPDIQRAERNLAASVADIGTETAELYPKFFITGSAGSQASLFGDLLSSASKVWSFGSLMQWSVFDGGSIRAQIDVEKEESKAALLDYEQTVLESLADVETALSNYGQELLTRKQLTKAVVSRQKAVSIAHELFNVGETDYLAILDAERELTTSEDDLVVSETQSIIKLITLYTALGGGWDAFESPPSN